MKSLLFSLYRTIRSVSFILMLIILITVLPLFATYAENISPVPAGFVCAETDSRSAQKIREYLLDNGFEECASADELYSEIAVGNLDCGVIIPDGLEARLHTGDLNGSLLFIDSPTALLSDLWREYAAAAVYSVYAPYITADTLSDSVIALDEVLAAYDEMMSSGYAFSFSIETANGASQPEQIRKTQFVLFASAVLVFITIIFNVCVPVVSDSNILVRRIGARRTVKCLYLPQVIIRNLLIWLASGVGVWIAGFLSFIPVLGVYIILINCTGFILISLFHGKSWLQVYTTLVSIATVALCPIFVDIVIYIPIVGFLRKLCPTYWLWMLVDNTVSGLFFGILAVGLTTAIQILCLYRRKIYI